MVEVAGGCDPAWPAVMPPRKGGTLEVYSDGACADQQDPMSARVAWAFHIPGPRGGSWAGPVAGR
eukprot:7376066-Lingulodinium_polyedra.AAC.1